MLPFRGRSQDVSHSVVVYKVIMIIGLPREIKDQENRVALTPLGSATLVRGGHCVLVQRDAGDGSGFGDEEYGRSGAQLVDDIEEVYGASDLILKVKEPQETEYPLLRPGQALFTFLHLAADPNLTNALLENGVTAIAYETVQLSDGSLPLLTPMSEIAGRLSIQVGAHYLEKPQGGRGKLLAGVTGVSPGKVVVLGAGVVGSNAAQIALGIGAHVTLIDKNLSRLRQLSQLLWGNLETTASNQETVGVALEDADLVIGAVLLPGAKAPRVVTREMVGRMTPGAVIVDVSIDQGGCLETSRPTTHSDPVYEVDGVIHYCVTNIPGSVARTATEALCNATLPYIEKLA
ncbi:MAG: alanine dehydrogenase, partial [Dehalococcoidia bacterium]